MKEYVYATIREGEDLIINGFKGKISPGTFFEFRYLKGDLFQVKHNGLWYEDCSTAFDFVHGWQPIETVKKGDFFKRKADSKKVLVKQEYNRFAKRYTANDFEDINNYQHFKKGTLVFTDFEF